MAIVAITNRKGGVGKTTLTANLAVALGRSVIVFDCDPQQSLVAWATMGEGTLSKIVRPLETQDPETFNKTLTEAAQKHRWVLVDTPPGFDTPALLAAQAADLVLLPTGPSPLEVLATRQTLVLMDQARASRSDFGKPRVCLVPSRVTRTRISKELERALRLTGEKTLPGICQRVVVAEATTAGLSVLEFAPRFSPAAMEIKRLAKAVQRIVKKMG